MERKLLKEILSIPSYIKKEQLVRDFIVSWADELGIEHRIDDRGNVYLKKGNIQDAPCVVAHMDTVHQDQAHMVVLDDKLTIKKGVGQWGEIYYALRKTYDGVMVNTGVGGDDKAGIFIALSIIKSHENILGAFFVEEETGCNGSQDVIDHEWLNQAGYFMMFDAPTGNWVSKSIYTTPLFNNKFEELLKPIWAKYELTKISKGDPYTDIISLRKNYDVCCINYFAGYRDMHTRYEYVVLDDVEKAISVGTATIEKLGNTRYLFNDVLEKV